MGLRLTALLFPASLPHPLDACPAMAATRRSLVLEAMLRELPPAKCAGVMGAEHTSTRCELRYLTA